MVRPIVNGLATGGEELLAKQVILTAIIYTAGVLSALGYSQIMVRAAQHVVSDIRRDLFAHIQTLPLSYFDSTRSGDIMSFFTNDVDTVSEALNNSFANVIQAAIQVVGTTAMLIILNWQLTIITLVCDAAIVLYARYSGARSKRFFAAQQASLGDLDGYIEEMVSGQKVIKVFNREAANVAGFTCRNDELRRTGTAAVSYANSMVPMTVVIGYVNYAIVAVAGGMLCIKGLADVGALASYLVFVRQAAMPINQFTQLGNFLLNALAGAERLFAAMDLEPEVDEAAWSWCRRATPRGRGRFPRARAWARTGTCMTWQPLMSRAARWPPTAPSSRAAWSRLPATCASMPWTFPTCRAPACSRTSTCLPSRGKRLRLWAPRRRQDDHYQPHQPLLRGR